MRRVHSVVILASFPLGSFRVHDRLPRERLRAVIRRTERNRPERAIVTILNRQTARIKRQTALLKADHRTVTADR